MTAPARRRPTRTRSIAAAAVCGLVVVIAIVLLVVLADNVVFYRTVSEAVHERKSQGTSRFRLAGAVVPHTVKQTRVGVDFEVTDGKKTVRVVNSGSPPELFKARVPVVCEGHWAEGLTFASDRILIKHGAQYQPPKVNADKAPKAKSS